MRSIRGGKIPRPRIDHDDTIQPMPDDEPKRIECAAIMQMRRDELPKTFEGGFMEGTPIESVVRFMTQDHLWRIIAFFVKSEYGLWEEVALSDDIRNAVHPIFSMSRHDIPPLSNTDPFNI